MEQLMPAHAKQAYLSFVSGSPIRRVQRSKVQPLRPNPSQAKFRKAILGNPTAVAIWGSRPPRRTPSHSPELTVDVCAHAPFSLESQHGSPRAEGSQLLNN